MKPEPPVTSTVLSGRDAAGRRASSSPLIQRSFLRTTSFNPDHVASMAHTLITTNPRGSASSFSVFLVTSVPTFAAFLGHETQTTPCGLSFLRNVASDL